MKRLTFGEWLMGVFMIYATAAWTSGTKIASTVILDLQGLGNPRSLMALLHFDATAGTATGYTGVVTLEHGLNSGLSDASTFATLTPINCITPGTAYDYVQQVDIAGAKRYLRITFTPTFSGTVTSGPIMGAYAAADLVSQPAQLGGAPIPIFAPV